MQKNPEEHKLIGKTLEQIILGGQDGLVNVLGIVLGVAVATGSTAVVLIAGIAAAVAESISMIAVAYTSTKTFSEYYEKEKQREIREIEELPDQEKKEIKEIFEKKGFDEKQVRQLVEIYSSNKEAWLDLMMAEELNLTLEQDNSPVKSALVVGVSCLAASAIPIVPFILLPVGEAIVYSFALSASVLFIGGGIKSKFTLRPFLSSASELAMIGLLAAAAGFLVGVFLQI